MKMGRIVVTLVFVSAMCLLYLDSAAQSLTQRKNAELFPSDGKKKSGGFYIAPGATYTLTRFSDQEELFVREDSMYSATWTPNGKLAVYVEAGWFHTMKDPYILDYIDFGLAYKRLSGRERYRGDLSSNDVLLGTLEGENTFSDSYLTAHFNANKLLQINDWDFVQLSLGVNADYRISRSLNESVPPIDTERKFPPQLLTQAHFKVGYGFKMNERLMIIPMLETPIFSITPADQGFGQLQWFNSLYRPVIFSVRFLWLRSPNGFDCPEVESGGSGKRRKQQPYKPSNYHP